jgi:hypothetical protein
LHWIDEVRQNRVAQGKEGKPLRLPRIVRESFLAFVVSSLMLPGAIAVATVFLFLTGPYGTDLESAVKWNSFLNRTPARACFFGALIALVFCALLAVVVCRRFTRADSACPGPFDQLRQGFDDVRARLERVCCEPKAHDTPTCGEAGKHRKYLEDHVFCEKRSPAGLPWLLGTGYIDAWQRLHSIEVALLRLEPDDRVVREALGDEMRLAGSNIPHSAALLKRLRTAVVSLSPTAGQYLIDEQQPNPAPPAPADDAAKNDARAALMQVRAAINEFRDSRREALVRARNRLYGAVIFSGITGCTFLFLAILSGATKTQILAASAFYLVGGVVGLVKLLQSAATGSAAAQDDYGLGVVRLIQTPLLAGLAAIGGVVLVQLTQGQGDLDLNTTFDLGLNPYGLVVAAFFGLTPSLLLSSLQQRTDQYRTDLTSVSPASSDAPGDAS